MLHGAHPHGDDDSPVPLVTASHPQKHQGGRDGRLRVGGNGEREERKVKEQFGSLSSQNNFSSYLHSILLNVIVETVRKVPCLHRTMCYGCMSFERIVMADLKRITSIALNNHCYSHVFPLWKLLPNSCCQSLQFTFAEYPGCMNLNVNTFYLHLKVFYK